MKGKILHTKERSRKYFSARCGDAVVPAIPAMKTALARKTPSTNTNSRDTSNLKIFSLLQLF